MHGIRQPGPGNHWGAPPNPNGQMYPQKQQSFRGQPGPYGGAPYNGGGVQRISVGSNRNGSAYGNMGGYGGGSAYGNMGGYEGGSAYGNMGGYGGGSAYGNMGGYGGGSAYGNMGGNNSNNMYPPRQGSFSYNGLGMSNNMEQAGSFFNGGYGGYGMNSMGGYGSMMGGSSFYGGGVGGGEEPPPLTYKLFSSRRDRGRLASQQEYHRHNSQYSLNGSTGFGSAMIINRPAPGKSEALKSPLPAGKDGVSKNPTSKYDARSTTTTTNTTGDQKSSTTNGAGTDSASTLATKRGVSKAGDKESEKDGRKSPLFNNVEDDNYSPDSKGSKKEGAPTAKTTTASSSSTAADKNQNRGQGKSEDSASKAAPISVTRTVPPKAEEKKPSSESKMDLEKKAQEKAEEERMKDSESKRIPLAHQLSVVEHKPVSVNDTFGDAEAREAAKKEEEKSRPRSRSMRGSVRRRSSVARMRGTSMVSMSMPEFPEAGEMKDNLDDAIANHKRPSFTGEEMESHIQGNSNDFGEHQNKSDADVQENINGLKKNDSEKKQEEERIKNLVEKYDGSNKTTQKKSEAGRATSNNRTRPSRRGSTARDLSQQPPDLQAGALRVPITEGQSQSREEDPERPIHRRPSQNVMSRQHEKEQPQNSEQADKKETSPPKQEEKQQEPQQQQQQQQDETAHTKDPKKSNPIRTLVLIEKHPRGSSDISTEGNTFSYRGTKHESAEVVTREPASLAYNANIFRGVRDAVCEGYNASIVSVEAPNTGKVFESPVWSGLTRVVRGVLQRNQNTPDRIVDLTAAFGFIHKDKVRDLWDENGGTFETLQVHPSPIYGPRIPQLRYSTVTSDVIFEEAMSAALRRAGSDPVLASTDGVAVALILSRQSRLLTTDAGEKSCDVLLSSLLVASTGSDTLPYEAALARGRHEYSTLFHLVLGGPCHTCFMLNLSNAEEGEGSREAMEKLIALQNKMHATYNYPLRSGSVTRFVKYVESANKEGRERLKHEENPEKRARLERYVQEQSRLLTDANKMLQDAREELKGVYAEL